jgi:hypothetical protein
MRSIEEEAIMRLLRLAAMVFAVVGGYLALPGAASAAPVGAGALPLAQAETPLVEQVQWGHRRHWGGYGHRRHWGGYGYRRHWGYRPVYGWGGPRLVCRLRYTPWGPRRVCWRRW